MQDTQIGELVAKVETDLTKLSEVVGSGSAGQNALDLRTSWRALVTHLALEPARPTRACPSCNGTIMRDATRCVHCWAASAPPEA